MRTIFRITKTRATQVRTQRPRKQHRRLNKPAEPRARRLCIQDVVQTKDVGEDRRFILKGLQILGSQRKVHGDGITILEVHNDLEVFWVRLGKAVVFEYHEDSIRSFFLA
jgi:hypothetical protein